MGLQSKDSLMRWGSMAAAQEYMVSVGKNTGEADT